VNIISKESYPIGLCTTIAVCFPWSRNLTFKITLDDHQSWVRDQYKRTALSWWHQGCGILYIATNLGSKTTRDSTGRSDDYEGSVHWTEQTGLETSSENMLLTIDMDRGMTTNPESRSIRRRTKTRATSVFVYNLQVHSLEGSREDENLTWQRDLTSLDLRKGDKRNVVHKSTNITWADEKM
jgi:hypothetical protein